MAAINVVSGSVARFPLGNRFLVVGIADDVTSGGDYISAGQVELSSIDMVVGATPLGATVAVQAVRNSTTGADSSAGALFLKSASTTTDVYFAVIGR